MKKSEIYNLAVIAVIEHMGIAPSHKATIIHELSAEYRVALMLEEQKKKREAEEAAQEETA